MTAIKPRTEHEEQKAIFQWANMHRKIYPGIHLLHAIPNGGDRDVRVARKLKVEGVKAGLPDLCLPVARRGYHGFYCEVKRKGARSRVSANQKYWHEQLMNQGFFVVVSEGLEEFIEAIQWYYATN